MRNSDRGGHLPGAYICDVKHMHGSSYLSVSRWEMSCPIAHGTAHGMGGYQDLGFGLGGRYNWMRFAAAGCRWMPLDATGWRSSAVGDDGGMVGMGWKRERFCMGGTPDGCCKVRAR